MPPDEPFLEPISKRWIPREMTEPPALSSQVRAGVIERNSALLINPFYPKDANARFGKHVLTPSLALTSFAATLAPDPSGPGRESAAVAISRNL
jgi:hypothetical protein